MDTDGRRAIDSIPTTLTAFMDEMFGYYLEPSAGMMLRACFTVLLASAAMRGIQTRQVAFVAVPEISFPEVLFVHGGDGAWQAHIKACPHTICVMYGYVQRVCAY